MWKLLFLLLVTAAASDEHEGDRECRSRIIEECETGDEPDDLPGTEEELEEFCKFALKYLECVNGILDDCNVEEIPIAHFRELNAAAHRVCDKDSLLYSALADSLPCFKKNQDVLAEPCIAMEGFSTFSETLESIGVTDVEASDDEPHSCLRVLYGMGCFASRVGELCGDVAREVAVDIAAGFDTPFENCPPGMKENLPQIARVMQMGAEKGETVENEIKKRK